MSIDVTNYLFRIDEDPFEYNNLAEKHPNIVADMSSKIHYWRTLHPASGLRAELMPPPGWRAPKNWATYMQSLAELQETAAPGMPPAHAIRPLDWQHGDAGRLIYNCEPVKVLGGGLCRN